MFGKRSEATLIFRRSKPPASTEIGALVDSLKNRLRVAVVCLSHSWGGLEQVAAEDAIDLAKLGLDVRCICLPDTPMCGYLKRFTEVKVRELPFRPRDILDLKMRKELKSLLYVERVNLIHTHQTTLLSTIVPWIWREQKVVICASRHIMNNHDKRDLIHAMMYRRLDALIVMSDALKENVMQTHRLRDRQIRTIHLGLDFKVFDPSIVDASRQRAEWGADESTIVIGMVGRIDPAKGQSTFIKAAAGLCKDEHLGVKVKFIVVGEETRGAKTKHLSELMELVAQYRLEDKVVFAGFKESIPEVMRAFDIFVMPSRQEAFGLVAIEAMAMECPIVISRGGSAFEIVGSQEFGLLVRPEDPFDLQSQIRFLLDHPEERIRMGKRAREHVMKNYSAKIHLQKTLEVYERCLRRRGL